MTSKLYLEPCTEGRYKYQLVDFGGRFKRMFFTKDGALKWAKLNYYSVTER